MDTSYYSDSSASPAGGGAVAGSSSGGYGALGAAHSGSLQSGLSTLSSSMSVSSQGGGGTLRRGTMGKSKSGFRLSSLSFSRGHKSADRSTEPKEDSVGKRFFCLFSPFVFLNFIHSNYSWNIKFQNLFFIQNSSMFWITLSIAWLLDWLDWLLLRCQFDWLIDWLMIRFNFNFWLIDWSDWLIDFVFVNWDHSSMDNQRSLNWRSWSFLTPVFLGGNRCFIGSLSRGSRHLRVTFRCELHVRGFVFRVFCVWFAVLHWEMCGWPSRLCFVMYTFCLDGQFFTFFFVCVAGHEWIFGAAQIHQAERGIRQGTHSDPPGTVSDGVFFLGASVSDGLFVCCGSNLLLYGAVDNLDQFGQKTHTRTISLSIQGKLPELERSLSWNGTWVWTEVLPWRVGGGKFCLRLSIPYAFCPCGLPLFQLRDSLCYSTLLRLECRGKKRQPADFCVFFALACVSREFLNTPSCELWVPIFALEYF